MKSILLPLLLVMSFSVKTMDDQKPFYPDPEISCSDFDVSYPASSTVDNRDKKVITIDEEDWKRINALIDALDKSEPVHVPTSQFQLFQRWEGKTPASRKTKLYFDRHTLNSIPKAGSYLITPGQLTDGQGRVIGINTAGIAPAQTVNYRIHYGDGQWDSEDACNTSEVIEGCGVNFDPERKQIIASFWRQWPKIKMIKTTTVRKNLATGQLDTSAELYYETYKMHEGLFGDTLHEEPDLAIVLKLEQKIIEFERDEKAKELKHENS